MSLIKQLFPTQVKFTPASSEVNWTRVETLVHGPGASGTSDHYNSAVFACLNVLANAYTEPYLTVYQRNGDKSEKLPNSPLQELLDNPTPNGELSSWEVAFWTEWAKHIDGNAYWLKIRSGNAETGNVIEYWPISPSLMAPVSENGEWISYYQYRIAPNQVISVPVQNVVHFRLGLDDRDMRKGLSPLKALVRQISTDDEADRFVDTLLKNYAVPGLVVVPAAGTSLKEDDADRITEKLRLKFGNDRRGNIAVMSKESTIQQFGFSPKDMDLSILHRVPEERISACFGVAAIVAGLGAGLDRATYANFKEAREALTEQTMIPQWRADAAKVNASLKPDFSSDKNMYVDFDLTNVRSLQEDEDSKYKRLQVAVGKPFMTRNEARTDIGLDPVEGWDDTDIEPPAPPTLLVPPDNSQDNSNDQAQQQDLNKWLDISLARVKRNKPPVLNFESASIPLSLHETIAGKLEKAKTIEEVKAAFVVEKEPDPITALVDVIRESNAILKASAG